MDDILVYSNSWIAHLDHLRQVFRLLGTNGFAVKGAKCAIAETQVQYLGHVISRSGLTVDTDKVLAIQQWPQPTNVTQLRGFLGITGYYRRFVDGYAQLAEPLTRLLRKDAFQWDALTSEVFAKLKKQLTTTPILALPDYSLPFIVSTDASGSGMGAVLTQLGHPLTFFSKQFSPALQLSSTYNRELAAIVLAVQKWRQYLLGHHFIIQTDHQPLRVILTQTIHTPEQQRWISKLMGFDFEVTYKPGRDNTPADSLSRVSGPVCLVLHGVSRPTVGIFQTIRALYAECELAKSFMANVRDNPAEYPEFTIRDNVLLFKGKFFVFDNQTIKQLLLQEYQDSVLGGHAGIARTTARLTANFYWKGIRKDVRTYIA